MNISFNRFTKLPSSGFPTLQQHRVTMPTYLQNHSPNYFLALRLSAETTDRLDQCVEQLKKWELTAQWTQDYHLTLCFLGPLTHDEAHMIPSAVELLVSSWKRPTLRFAGLGARAGRRVPQSVYVALNDQRRQCHDFHQDLCASFDVIDKQPFLPHVTLCRPLSSSRDEHEQPRWHELFSAFGMTEWGNCVCDELALFVRNQPSERSTLRYRVVNSWPLPP
jgi:2'-5' RNA ligase